MDQTEMDVKNVEGWDEWTNVVSKCVLQAFQSEAK